MVTDMKESGLEAHIESVLVERGYVVGLSTDFDREYAVDLDKLFAFLLATQPDVVEAMGIGKPGSSRTSFLFRLSHEITSRGVLDVLLKGVRDKAHHVDLFYGTPSALNERAKALFAANTFSVTRQVRYSQDDRQHAVDMVCFVNGLPLATFELKNNLTGQTYHDAIRQYQDTRPPSELLFRPGRCAVHLALDEQQAYFCTELKGAASWFLPFNRGHHDGAGNPPNPDGFRTEYVWSTIFAPPSLVDIIEHYARKVSEKDPRTKKLKTKYIWPRFHQLEGVRSLLDDARTRGAGHRYLIQHSAGSGKSYSITWLAHQLINLTLEEGGEPLFHTVIVITDRRVLDTQIRNEIKRFTQVKAIVGAVTEGSAQLQQYLEQGKRIITSTIQKFPFILDALGDAHRDKRFALVIDEAHSSQGGKSAAAVNRALARLDEEVDAEDQLLRIMENRKMLGNASYFAFTATPKNKTEEIFGTRQPDGSFRPFHSYTMKQAIQEGFIKDVLAHYTTVESYYRLVKTVEEDPEFDIKRAQQKLRRYVESHDKPMREKAGLMWDHFVREVYLKRLVGGKARAMLVTDGVERVLNYRAIFKQIIAEQELPIDVVVAFSGEREWGGKKVTEASLNGFPSQSIPDKLREDPYRILIVADKFQTGFDEPLLQTMYVDKSLSDVKAVQTLSRLNRAHPDKAEVFVLDFANDAEAIRQSFAKYYRTTILSEATDVNKLHDLKRDLDAPQVYSEEKVETVVQMFLEGDSRADFEGILDGCVEIYIDDLGEEEQVAFKGNAKGFVRLYNFLSALIDFTDASWERLSIFLNFLIPKLPTPKEEDMSRGLVETIDLESYRNEIKARQHITLEDEDGELNPVPVSTPKDSAQTELDFLSQIVSTFNQAFGGDLNDPEFMAKVVTSKIQQKSKGDMRLSNAVRQGDRKKVELETARVMQEAMVELHVQYADHTQDVGTILKGFVDNPQQRRFLMGVAEQVLKLPYNEAVLSHPGWDDTIDLMDDAKEAAFARGLKARGVPAPMDTDFEIPGTDNERALLVWTFEGEREPVAIVSHEVGEGARDVVLVHVGKPLDAAAVAPQLVTILAPRDESIN
jgi:type I restriction enzyme R subunit